MESRVAPADHLVWFYDERARLLDRIVAFLGDGLRAGEQALLIATGDDLADVGKHLAGMGIDTSRLTARDAAATLDRFCHDGAIDRDAFDASVGDLVRTLASAGPLRVFGEMVAHLWHDGEVQAAVQLESMWAELREHTPFQLLCAYPSPMVLDERMQNPVNAVCSLHSEITLGDAGDPATAMRVYPASVHAVREARHFVRTCLGGGGDRAEDVALIVSELASNAVRHARSPFAVHVTVEGPSVRIGVRDASNEGPRLVPASGMSETGRGVATIAALSERWGTEEHPVGKTVWAELPLTL